MTQNRLVLRSKRGWNGIGLAIIFAGLLLFLLSFSVGLVNGSVIGGVEPTIEVSPLAMVSIQPTDSQMSQTLTISNSGTADLLWNIEEQPLTVTENQQQQTFQLETGWGAVEVEYGLGCPLPLDGDVPWVAVSPTMGTTSAGSADDSAVTFDSTGIALGVQRANLCANNNSITPTVEVPVILEVPPAPGLVLTKTVGFDSNDCAATDLVNISSGMGGTSVTYCYRVENTGNITLSVHNLVDDQFGVLLGPDALVDLSPGTTEFYTVSTVLTQTTVNTGTWTAANALGVHMDPAGDTFGVGGVQLDITEFQAATDVGTLTVQMVFSGTISPPGSGKPDDVAGFVEIDRDSSPLTGLSLAVDVFCPMPPVIGSDFFVDISTYNAGPGTMTLFFADEFQMTAVPVGLVNVAFTSNSFTVDIPLSLFEVYGPEEGIMDIVAVIGTTLAPTDCAPDNDVLTSRVEVSASDSATVTQDNPTGVTLTDLNGAANGTWLPVWLMALALLAMVVSAVFPRFSEKGARNR